MKHLRPERQAVIGKRFPARVAVVCLVMSKATQTMASIDRNS
jgi:hypothetical protein